MYHSIRVFDLTKIYVLVSAVLCSLTFTSTVTAAESEAPAVPLDYEISPEDVLEISVWREPELQRQVIVRPDGGISFPLVGNVKAAGSTPEDLETTLREGLSKYIPDAVVSVSVVQLRGLRIYVTGRVRNPGQFEVGRYVDVLQAITLAGGFTPFANRKEVKILRNENDGTEQVFFFNYADVEKGRNLKQNIMLRADDIVVVP